MRSLPAAHSARHYDKELSDPVVCDRYNLDLHTRPRNQPFARFDGNRSPEQFQEASGWGHAVYCYGLKAPILVDSPITSSRKKELQIAFHAISHGRITHG